MQNGGEYDENILHICMKVSMNFLRCKSQNVWLGYCTLEPITAVITYIRLSLSTFTREGRGAPRDALLSEDVHEETFSPVA